VREALQFITVETVDAVFPVALVSDSREDTVQHLSAIAGKPLQEVRHGNQF